MPDRSSSSCLWTGQPIRSLLLQHCQIVKAENQLLRAQLEAVGGSDRQTGLHHNAGPPALSIPFQALPAGTAVEEQQVCWLFMLILLCQPAACPCHEAKPSCHFLLLASALLSCARRLK